MRYTKELDPLVQGFGEMYPGYGSKVRNVTDVRFRLAARDQSLPENLQAIDYELMDSEARRAPQATAAQQGIPTRLSLAPQNEQAALQRSLVNGLMQRAAGKGPASAAENQLRTNVAGSQAAQTALGRTSNNVGSSARRAAYAGAAVGLQGAQDVQQLRLAEQQQAQDQLGSVLSGMRDQNTAVASAQAGLTQAQRSRDAANRQATALGNQNAGIQTRNQQAANEQFLLGQKYGMQENQARATLGAESAYQQYMQFQDDLMSGIIRDKPLQQQRVIGAGLNAMGTALAAGGAAMNQPQQTWQPNAPAIDVDQIPSDERLKTGVATGDGDARSFLDALRAKTYEYKNPAKHGAGERLGIIAQDIVKSKLGREVVSPAADGLYLDTNRAVSAALAGLGNLNERLKKLEHTK